MALKMDIDDGNEDPFVDRHDDRKITADSNSNASDGNNKENTAAVATIAAGATNSDVGTPRGANLDNDEYSLTAERKVKTLRDAAFRNDGSLTKQRGLNLLSPPALIAAYSLTEIDPNICNPATKIRMRVNKVNKQMIDAATTRAIIEHEQKAHNEPLTIQTWQKLWRRSEHSWRGSRLASSSCPPSWTLFAVFSFRGLRTLDIRLRGEWLRAMVRQELEDRMKAACKVVPWHF